MYKPFKIFILEIYLADYFLRKNNSPIYTLRGNTIKKTFWSQKFFFRVLFSKGHLIIFVRELKIFYKSLKIFYKRISEEKILKRNQIYERRFQRVFSRENSEDIILKWFFVRQHFFCVIGSLGKPSMRVNGVCERFFFFY